MANSGCVFTRKANLCQEKTRSDVYRETGAESPCHHTGDPQSWVQRLRVMSE